MVKPWYKQFWPWFLLALPLAAVIGSFTTLAIFTKNQVSLVAEDYYKKGKGINVDLSRLKVADELELNASIVSDDKMVIIRFNKGQLQSYPSLKVTMTHRTLADKDFSQMVTADGKGLYRMQFSDAISGPWFVEVGPHDNQWMLQGRINFPSTDPVELTGQY
ncbi:FixH family protein [Aliivibrio kagoshimensis]|uniref:FixH family protein n=1 Tax=Aliivibrio kagoshimensis TaxID=2910230 RepID=UPI003D0AD0D6